MKWLTNLFKSGSQKPSPSNPTIDPKKDISEPVLAIVKAMYERPSSFKVKSDTFSTLKIRDLKLGSCITIIHDYSFITYQEDVIYWSWDWLTEDEKEILAKTFKEMQKIKKSRRNSIARARMKAIYA